MHTRFMPLLSVHIDCSTSTLSPMEAGKLELFEIADATANLRKSIRLCSNVRITCLECYSRGNCNFDSRPL